jgi:hypothetical protein
MVTLYLRHGRTVVWGDASQTAVKARELAILMRGQARYFDVSNPRAVVTAPTAPPADHAPGPTRYPVSFPAAPDPARILPGDTPGHWAPVIDLVARDPTVLSISSLT